jgi:hypothetical protein
MKTSIMASPMFSDDVIIDAASLEKHIRDCPVLSEQTQKKFGIIKKRD